MKFARERLDTPTGALFLVTDDDDEQRLRAVDWEDHEPRLVQLLRRHYGSYGAQFDMYPLRRRPSAASRALQDYFEGDLQAIDAVATATNGTPFQRAVWEALRRIPTGETISYQTLAARIGRPAAVRAVGLANGSNPVSIVVPCHRVIGSNGTLTGYGGGLPRKRWLLAHEGALAVAGRGAGVGRVSGDGRGVSESRPAQPQLFGSAFTKFPGSAD